MGRFELLACSTLKQIKGAGQKHVSNWLLISSFVVFHCVVTVFYLGCLFTHRPSGLTDPRNKQIQLIMRPTDLSVVEKLLPQTSNSEQMQKAISYVTPWSLMRLKMSPHKRPAVVLVQSLLTVHSALCVVADDGPFPLNWHTHISLPLSHQCMRNYLMRNGSHISTNSLTHERVRLIAAFG